MSKLKKITYKPMDYFGVGNLVPVKYVIFDMHGIKKYSMIEPSVNEVTSRARIYTHFLTQNYDKRSKTLTLVYASEHEASVINEQYKLLP